MSEVYIRSQNKEKLYRLGGNYACVEYGEYEDIKKKRAGESKHQTGREKVKDTHKCKLWLWGLPFSA